jgi:iron-sulfur cluster assembly protein
MEDDEIIDNSGVKVLVDKESMPYLTGSTLDFSTDIMNSGFTFSNPNATRTCGCGKSFCG